MSTDRFIFTLVWLIGYLHRRDFVVGLAHHLGNRFMCFGDGYWTRFIDPSLVSANACYYTTLCRYYRSTKVNININRIQIRTSFTQRIFDCLASGAFILTDRREMNKRFFRTSGPDRELVEFDSLQHCLSLIEHFVRNEDERLAIAQAGRIRVLNEHTYDHRIHELFTTVRTQFGI